MEKTRSGMNAECGAGKDLYMIGGPMGVGKTTVCPFCSTASSAAPPTTM